MSDNGAELVTNKYGETFINLINSSHFSNLSAEQIITAAFLQKLNKRGTFYVILGTDSGLFPKFLSKLPLPEKSKYLFIELDVIYPVARELAGNVENEQIIIATTENWETRARENNIAHYIFDDKLTYISSLGANEGHIDNYLEMYDEIKQKLFNINFEFTTGSYSNPFIHETILNSYNNDTPAKLLEKTASGKVLILAAGPSLKDHIYWIKNNQDKIHIIAVSRIARILIENEINPDIVTSVDPKDTNYQMGHHISKLQNTILVHANHVSHRLLENYQGQKYYTGNRFYWNSRLNHPNYTFPGPTVTHSSIFLAIKMGFNEIYLAGVDLCFDSSANSHADDYTKDKKIDAEVMTYEDQTRKTSHDFLLGIKTLSEIAKSFDGKIYNLNKTAAKIDNILYSKYPIQLNTKPTLKTQINIDENKIAERNIIDKELKKAQNKYIEIKNLCEQALLQLNKTIKIKNVEKLNVIHLKIDHIEAKLNSKKYSNYIKLVKHAAGKKYLSLINKASDQKSQKHEYEWLKEYYESQIEGVNSFLPTIIKVLADHTE